jgi:hypothetical protein
MYEFVLISRLLLLVFALSVVGIAGCVTETLKPTFPTPAGVQQPDRVLVYEFVVTPADLARGGIVGSGLERSAAQTEEDIRIGRALAKALAENLVNDLQRRGIESSLAAEAARPGKATASIRGQFQSTDPGQRGGAGFTLNGKELRTHIQILQGSELNLRVVAESEYTMPSSLRPGLPPEILAKAVNADAMRAAQALADRIADYYRKEGWLK